MNARPDFGEYGSARYALTAPTCDPRPPGDFVLLPVFLLLYALVAVAVRLAPRAWKAPGPFMCPVCFWAGTRAGLRPAPPEDDGSVVDSICPRCGSSL